MIIEKPKMEVVQFEAEDIIVTSTPGCPEDCPSYNCASHICNFVGCNNDDNW